VADDVGPAATNISWADAFHTDVEEPTDVLVELLNMRQALQRRLDTAAAVSIALDALSFVRRP
jgi:hypothetical protein